MDIITGSSGFIGGTLHRYNAALNKRSYPVDIQTGIDIRHPVELPECNTLYHLAGLSNIIPSITDPRAYYETNVTGTFNVLEAARKAGCRKFVYAASASCYGEYPEVPLAEGGRVAPAYPYALTKRMGEELVLHYGEVYGMDVVSLRIFNCYGPGSLTKSAYGAMFNTFMAQKANGKPLTVVGDGKQSRDFVYVDDVVGAFLLASKVGSGVYNLGSGVATSILRVAELVGGEVVHIPKRSGEPDSIYADNSRLRALGWKPWMDIKSGVTRMLEEISYWKDAKVWEPSAIAKETEEWEKLLK